MPIPELSAAEAHARLDAFHPVDVREEHEFHGPLGRVPGARWLPLGALEERLGELPEDRELLVVCRSGVRSAKACERLRAAGLRATNLAGGMIAWNRANLPVEERPPESLVELRDLLIAWLAQLSQRPPQAVADRLRAALDESIAPFDEPTRDGLERMLELAEQWFEESGPPPDLEDSLATFRRWLAAL